MKKLVVVVKDMKKFILSCLCALAAVVLSADETAKKPVAAVSVEKPAAAVPAKEPIRVACVGDSITYGHGASNRVQTSYPAQLQTLLGDEWSVVNFGHNARTALDDGKEWNGKGGMGYRKSPEFAKALASKPDIVVFMLGTNDSKPVNWDGKSDDVKRDYAKLVDDFLALDPKPVVLIAASPFVKKDSFSDAYAVTKAAADKSYIGDGVHPNDAGYGVIAAAFAEKLRGLRGGLDARGGDARNLNGKEPK